MTWKTSWATAAMSPVRSRAMASSREWGRTWASGSTGSSTPRALPKPGHLHQLRAFLAGDSDFLREFTLSAWKGWPEPAFFDWVAAPFEASGNPYAWLAGTSMAAPKVAAVAALIINHAEARGERLRPDQVVAWMKQVAVDQGKPGYDPYYYGYGMVSSYTALGGR